MPTVDELLGAAPPKPKPTTVDDLLATSDAKRAEEKRVLKAQRTAEREAAKQEAAPPTEEAPGTRAGAVLGGGLRGPGPWKEGIEPVSPETEVRPPYAPPPVPLSRLEEAGWTAASVAAPMVLGTGGTLAGGPVAGATLAGLGGAGVAHLRQKREQELRLRGDISPGLIAFEGLTSAIPGAPLEKLGIKTLVPKIAARGVEGAIMGGGGATGRALIGEGRLPTVDELLWGASVGGATGLTVGGGAEYVGHRVGGRAGAPDVVPPEKLATAPSLETPAATHPIPPGGEPPPPPPPGAGVLPPPVEPVRMFTKPGEMIGAGGGGRAPLEVAPPPPPGAEAPPPPGAEPPPPGRPLPPEEYGRVPTAEEAAEARPWAESPFRKVPGLGEAVTGEERVGARPRDPERLAGEIRAIPRLFGNLSPEGQQVIEYSVRENADAIAERAGQTRPMEQTRQLARDLTFDPRKAAKQPRGTIYNDVQLEAIGNHVEGLGQRIERLRAEYEADPTSEMTKGRLKNAYDELTLTVLAYKGGKAEVGRALNMMKARKRALDMGDARFVTEANRAGISAEGIAKILRDTDPLDNKARFEALVRSRKPGFWKQFDSFLFQNLLSAPTTQERNIAGNTINLVKTPITTPVAGAMDWARVAAMGGERQIYASEAFSHAAGWKDAFRPAVKGFFHMMAKGYAPGAEEHFEIPPVEILEGRSNVTRALANPVTRMMRGMDYFFRTLVTQGESRGLAYRNARNQATREQAAGAIAPDQFKSRFAELVADFNKNPTPEMLAAAKKFGERGVFQESGQIDKIMSKFQEIPVLGRRILPFVRTPMAIIRQGFQLTPAGFFTKAGRPGGLEKIHPSLERFSGQGGRAGMQARAEAFAGSMGMLALYLLAEEGSITGSGPSDPNERERLYKTGWRPNSVLMNGRYYGYGITGPLAIPISIVANARDRMKELEDAGDPVGAEDVAWTTIQRMHHTILDQSYLKGLNDLLDAVDSPGTAEDPIPQKVQRVAANVASQAIPASSLLRSIATTMDPELKAPETFTEELEARLPVLSERVPPRIRSTGEPISIQKPPLEIGPVTIPGWASQMFVPTDVSPKVSDPVGTEMHRLGVPFPVPQEDKIRYRQGGKDIEVTPTREEALAMRQAKGFAQQAALEELMAQPNWASMSDTLRKTLSERKKSRATVMVQDRATRLKKNGEPITVDAIYPPYLGPPKISWAPR